MSPIEAAARLLAVLIEWVKGPRTTEEVVTPRTRSDQLIGRSISGFEIKIHCQERRYRVRYRHWYIPNKEIKLYHVYATTSDDSPKRLKEACMLELTFPGLISEPTREQKQKESVIAAYLDILITRLETSVIFSA